MLLYSFIYTMYFGVVTSHKMFFSYISTSSLSYVRRFFSKRKLMKTSLHTQLKQTNLEDRLNISTEIPKEGFNDTAFQHFVDELKQFCSDMQIYLQLLVSVFLFLYSIYLVFMLPFRITCFALFLFLVNLQYISPLLQD